MGDWSGTVPTILGGYTPTGDDWDSILDELTAMSAVWTDWTPTLTNLTLGNGTVSARYRRVGKTLDYRFRFTLGSSSAVGTGPAFTLPYAPAASYVATNESLGEGFAVDAGVNSRRASARLSSGSTLEIVGYSTTGIQVAITSLVPHTWGTADVLAISGSAIELA